MGQILRTWHIIAILSLLHKVVCNHLEIALEQLYLLTVQIRDLEQVDFIIVDVWLKLFWNI